MNEWSEHWSEAHQTSLSQKFFSFCRKTVFARSVRYFVSRYFPHSGVFVEAGSGTSETSISIDKCGGSKTLIAVDIVFPVLERCHPVMDVQVCADVFHLPFRESSIDGIWNVGVMEHFTHEQIDKIMCVFHRVLRNGGRVIFFWPGIDSIPQKLLHVVEKTINLKRERERERFRFHLIPDEISQLSSLQEGREILTRNGFHPLHIENGFRSLTAFKTLIGEKA